MSIQSFTSRQGIILSVALLSLLAIVYGAQQPIFTSVPTNQTHTLVAKQQLNPAIDIPPSKTPDKQTVVLAGGCFWGVEAVFEKLQGVSTAVSGYAGGSADTANYYAVSSGTTGHAEAVQITYDPQQISFGQLLKIFFVVAHDPTQVNRQGPDHGTQYRSAIFFANPAQQKVAQAYISQLNQAKVFSQPIATQLVVLKEFYPAENSHQNFIDRHPDYPYVVVHDLPKLAHLQQEFPELVRR
jgi:peptide-methionine (S)-S-oxide reductase